MKASSDIVQQWPHRYHDINQFLSQSTSQHSTDVFIKLCRGIRKMQ